jgi:hypothetical protein
MTQGGDSQSGSTVHLSRPKNSQTLRLNSDPSSLCSLGMTKKIASRQVVTTGTPPAAEQITSELRADVLSRAVDADYGLRRRADSRRISRNSLSAAEVEIGR